MKITLLFLGLSTLASTTWAGPVQDQEIREAASFPLGHGEVRRYPITEQVMRLLEAEFLLDFNYLSPGIDSVLRDDAYRVGRPQVLNGKVQMKFRFIRNDETPDNVVLGFQYDVPRIECQKFQRSKNQRGVPYATRCVKEGVKLEKEWFAFDLDFSDAADPKVTGKEEYEITIKQRSFGSPDFLISAQKIGPDTGLYYFITRSKNTVRFTEEY